MPERVRVLHLVKGLGPGGAERLLVELMGVADHEAFEHRVAYVLPHKDHLVAELRECGAQVACLAPRWPLRLRAALRDVDVAHLHSPLPAAVARVVALPRRRPVTVSTEHNSWRSYALATRVANAATFPIDRHHFVVSADAAASVWRPWRDGTEVLRHGIDVEATARHGVRRQEMRRTLGLSDEDVAVVCVANYRRDKDHATLLRAARRVAALDPRVRFLLVGQGPLADEVASLHRSLGLAPTVELLGYRPDARAVVAAADLFALSSVHEGLPVALMEALALGVPVVATAVGGIPDAVTSGVEGLLVEAGDDAALAHAVVALAGDDQRRRTMAAAATAKGRSFDIRPAAARLERVYAELAAER